MGLFRLSLSEQADCTASEREVSLRPLHDLASSVHHQQHHDTDIVTIRVDTPASGRG